MRIKPYVRASYLDGFQALILSRGGKPNELVQAAGLAGIPRDSHCHLVALDKFFYLLELSAKQLNFPALGLELAKHQDSSIFGPLSYRISRCSNLDQALEVVVEYLRVQVVGIELSVERQAGATKIIMATPLREIGLGQQYQSYVLAILYTTIKTIMGGRCPLRACFFPMTEPENIEPYNQLFHCPIAFEQQQLAITIDSKLLAQQLGDLSQLVAEKIQTIMQDCSEREFICQVEKLMASYVIAGNCRLDDVAESFCCSGRTLQRRFQHNGTSFYGLLNAVKARLAKQLLQHTCYRLTDISLMLGYQQLSSFSRSYYRWYGENPSETQRLGLFE